MEPSFSSASLRHSAVQTDTSVANDSNINNNSNNNNQETEYIAESNFCDSENVNQNNNHPSADEVGCGVQHVVQDVGQRGGQIRDLSVGGGCKDNRGRSRGRDEAEEEDLALGPRVRGRSQRRAIASAASTMSAPPPVDEQTRLQSGRNAWTARGVSPRRSINGLVDFAVFRDSNDASNNDGSSHRAGSVSLPSATWTPPSLRYFGFPTEFKGFVEVAMMQYLTPWTNKIWNVVKDDVQHLPDNWKEIPAQRRLVYVITTFVSGYYFLVSLYAIPLVALGFLTPAYLCRQYLDNGENEEDDNNNNNDDDVAEILGSVKEMSRWMKFWVSFSGWLLASSLSPRILAAILPLKILTLLFVIASLVAPWTTNPSVLLFDRLLLPLFHRIDGLVESHKEKIIAAVSGGEVKNKRR